MFNNEDNPYRSPLAVFAAIKRSRPGARYKRHLHVSLFLAVVFFCEAIMFSAATIHPAAAIWISLIAPFFGVVALLCLLYAALLFAALRRL